MPPHQTKLPQFLYYGRATPLYCYTELMAQEELMAREQESILGSQQLKLKLKLDYTISSHIDYSCFISFLFHYCWSNSSSNSSLLIYNFILLFQNAMPVFFLLHNLLFSLFIIINLFLSWVYK